MDWTFVWILSFLIFWGSSSNAAPAPKPGDDNMLGGYGDALGLNHVPRLGRRSLRPYTGGELFSNRNMAGLFGPFNRYDTFRYYGGRPGEELARGLLRDKRKPEEYSDVQGVKKKADEADVTKNAPAEATKTKAGAPDLDLDYWKNVIGEATINSVLEKMEEIGETREIIEDFNQYKAFGVGNPLPKYLARWSHPVNSPKVPAPQTSYQNKAMLNKYKGYFPKSSIAFPRRKKGRTFTRIFSRR